jgi:hypothetical protein
MPYRFTNQISLILMINYLKITNRPFETYNRSKFNFAYLTLNVGE